MESSIGRPDKSIKYDSLMFIHKTCIIQMHREFASLYAMGHKYFSVYKCPDCHYLITCEIKVMDDNTTEIQIVCETCGTYMNLLPDYVTPQRGTLYYRCYRCHQAILLRTMISYSL
ncbi:MAG: hypothetical protein ACTSQI_09295 [Candidatus Helarchaeota archaeon]